jgi:hypothetical protein
MDRDLLEEALRACSPSDALRNLVQAKVDQGYDRETLNQELTDFTLELRAVNRESDEDLILDVLDFLTGWCSPHMKI